MEFFLNLCWLSLLLPAWLLWRQRPPATGCDRSASPAASPLVFLCALGCAFVLLFPVISASDDLHAMRPEMEESEQAFRGANRCASAGHALHHSAQPALVSSVSLWPSFEQTNTVFSFTPRTLGILPSLAPSGRAPPEHSIGL
jgi:hypothetical protein